MMYRSPKHLQGNARKPWTLMTTFFVMLILSFKLTTMAGQQPLEVQAPQAPLLSDYRTQWFYGFMSPGVTNDPERTALWELGAGYERLLTRSLALRADGSIMVAGVEGMDWGFPVSLNASYYLRRALITQRQWTPFLTGGYTRGGFARSSNMFNVGAGINQWTQGCCGFRFEVLHHMNRCGSGPDCRRDWYLDARLGFVIDR
jgi:hypothetical protein